MHKFVTDFEVVLFSFRSGGIDGCPAGRISENMGEVVNLLPCIRQKYVILPAPVKTCAKI